MVDMVYMASVYPMSAFNAPDDDDENDNNSNRTVGTHLAHTRSRLR